MHVVRRIWELARWACNWLCSPIRRSETRASLLLRASVQLVALAFAASTLLRTVRPLFRAPPVPSIPPDHDGERFGVSEEQRRAIFLKIADIDDGAVAMSQAKFPGMAWSQGDDQAAYERNAARQYAAQFHLNLAQIYLIIDEGIRKHWPASDGQPLRATITPLDPRKQ
jgi:hypothetical protein